MLVEPDANKGRSYLRRIMNQEEILKSQGTRLSDVPPWMSYAASMQENLDPDLEAAVKEYEQNRYESTSSETQEELARQKELSNDLAKQYQFLHPDEYKDEGPRIGRIIHSSEFIKLLQTECGLSCWFRKHPQPKKLTLIVKREGIEPEVACWAQEGFMPEYEIVRFDDHGVPLDSKYRGWRTCLLQMILKDIVTEELAHKVFGKAEGPVSERYNSTLYGFRNTYVKVVDKNQEESK